MRVLVCGGRHFDDTRAVWDALDAQNARRPITLLIEGGEGGADLSASNWAVARGIRHETFRAARKTQGWAADPIRNQRMIDEGKPDLVIAFPGGRRAADMVRRARMAGIEVLEPLNNDEPSRSAP